MFSSISYHVIEAFPIPSQSQVVLFLSLRESHFSEVLSYLKIFFFPTCKFFLFDYFLDFSYTLHIFFSSAYSLLSKKHPSLDSSYVSLNTATRSSALYAHPRFDQTNCNCSYFQLDFSVQTRVLRVIAARVIRQ